MPGFQFPGPFTGQQGASFFVLSQSTRAYTDTLGHMTWDPPVTWVSN